MLSTLILVLFSLLIAPYIKAESQNHTLHHRFLPIPSSSSSPPPFLPYGTITIHPGPPRTATFSESSHEAQNVDQQPIGIDGNAWYQVLLNEETRVMASTRACFLAIPGMSFITVLLDGSAPIGIELKRSDIPVNGECPSDWQASSLLLPSMGSGTRVEVRVSVPELVDKPILAPPPQVDSTTGQPAPPPVEKTLLQKYWIPLLGVSLFIVAQLGSDPGGRGGPAAGVGGGR
ncbi:MAG: hypothetical protein TREMPRED_003489 [Tremellales sp. Tagirdzhanova-0007]|nr:MAG: hypothetical protein TREMPRED_003489 [Tremellales sp. Tagirdzhanova-0007]